MIICITLLGACTTLQAQDDGAAKRVRAIDAMLQRYLKTGEPGAVVLVSLSRPAL